MYGGTRTEYRARQQRRRGNVCLSRLPLFRGGGGCHCIPRRQEKPQNLGNKNDSPHIFIVLYTKYVLKELPTFCKLELILIIFFIFHVHIDSVKGTSHIYLHKMYHSKV